MAGFSAIKPSLSGVWNHRVIRESVLVLPTESRWSKTEQKYKNGLLVNKRFVLIADSRDSCPLTSPSLSMHRHDVGNARSVGTKVLYLHPCTRPDTFLRSKKSNGIGAGEFRAHFFHPQEMPGTQATHLGLF